MQLDTLTAAGLTVRVDGDRLIVGPKDRLTPALREQITDHKAELLALLAGPESLQDAQHGPLAATDRRYLDDAGNERPDDVRTAPPYACWYAGCDGIATGPWRRITSDCWQAECSAGHLIQRTAYSFEHPPDFERAGDRRETVPIQIPEGR